MAHNPNEEGIASNRHRIACFVILIKAAVDESQDKETNESFFDTIKPRITDPLVKVLLQVLTTVSKMLTPDCSYKAKKGVNDMYQRISDIASYFVCCGLLDRYYRIFQCIREPLEDTSVLAAYHTTIEMLQGIVAAIVRYALFSSYCSCFPLSVFSTSTLSSVVVYSYVIGFSKIYLIGSFLVRNRLDNTFNSKKDDSVGLLQFFKNTHLLGTFNISFCFAFGLHSAWL